MAANALFYGDNLVWLRDHKYFPHDSVDLIYLDPPFNSKADYNVLFHEPGKGSKSQAQIRAFDDTWHWDNVASEVSLNELANNKPQVAEFISWLSRRGKENESMAAYLSMMAVRLIEMHRVLKASGSLYLHCDPTASHYLKILMDSVFGKQCYCTEIIWSRSRGFKRSSARRFPHKHDTILFYCKDPNRLIFHPQYRPHKPEYIKRFKKDADGRLYRDDVNPTKGGRRIIYLDEVKGDLVESTWYDIAPLNPIAAERLGYPTQKPLALLERIVQASSNKGDVVLDPFCGCGTTIDAAQKLGRHWLGIDVTWLAIDLVEKRLKATYGSRVAGKYEVHGKPYDVASAQALANKSKKEFEIWAVTSVGATPREHDGGVDGIMGFVEKNKKIQTIIVQVKGGDALNPGMVRDLIGTVKKEGAAIGLLVTLKEPTAGMNTLAVHSEPYKSELWGKEFPSIQIRIVEELFAGKTFDLPPTKSLLKNAQLAKEQGQQISQDI